MYGGYGGPIKVGTSFVHGVERQAAHYASRKGQGSGNLRIQHTRDFMKAWMRKKAPRGKGTGNMRKSIFAQGMAAKQSGVRIQDIGYVGVGGRRRARPESKRAVSPAPRRASSNKPAAPRRSGRSRKKPVRLVGVGRGSLRG